MPSKRENYAIFLILGVLSAAVTYSAFNIPQGGELGFGADFMPKVVGILLVLCSLGFLVQGVRAECDEKKESRLNWTPVIRFFMALGLLVLYTALIKPVGFIIMTILYIFAQSQIMVPPEKRSYLLSGAIAVGSALVIYYVFTNGLSIALPGGILSGIL